MAEAADWQKLAGALRELHRVLLERARQDYERDHLANLSPGQFLQLLTTNAEFGWLRALAELMVDLDLVSDAEPQYRDETATAVRAAVEYVIAMPKAPDPGSPFAQRYWTYVHADPHTAMAHAGVKQAIAAWPRPPQDDAAGLLHERHRLAEKARHLSRRRQGLLTDCARSVPFPGK
ncbi:MAG: hypothetical protein K8S22_14400 [Betaproteobacteria bacterium]|nr:hypothetical protein [Betaproteobacteria bacterium]